MRQESPFCTCSTRDDMQRLAGGCITRLALFGYDFGAFRLGMAEGWAALIGRCSVAWLPVSSGDSCLYSKLGCSSEYPEALRRETFSSHVWRPV